MKTRPKPAPTAAPSRRARTAVAALLAFAATLGAALALREPATTQPPMSRVVAAATAPAAPAAPAATTTAPAAAPRRDWRPGDTYTYDVEATRDVVVVNDHALPAAP